MPDPTMDFINSLSQPLVPNSPMVTPTTANNASVLPFVSTINAPVGPATPGPAPASNKWMAISVLGALAFGLYYMSGGFGGGEASAAPASKSRSRRRRKSSSRRRAPARRRKSRSRGKRRGRERVTWGY